MKDWRTYFKTRLTEKGQFVFKNETRRGQTNILTFGNANPDNLTIIQVGIFDNGDLITFEFHNPQTPGYTEQQRREYFYRCSFRPTETYGGPGLEFIQLNIGHFDKLLQEGLKGKEIQFYRRGQLIKSMVFQSYSGNSHNDYGTTVRFKRKGIANRFLELFISNDILYDHKAEVELREVFAGIK